MEKQEELNEALVEFLEMSKETIVLTNQLIATTIECANLMQELEQQGKFFMGGVNNVQ